MTTRYDHPDSVTVRAEAAQSTPAQPSGSDAARLAKRYDHSSRQGREPTKAPPPVTAAERLLRRYDHPDSKAVRDERPANNPQLARARARDARLYDHEDSTRGREASAGKGDDEERPGGGDLDARPATTPVSAPQGFDANDPTFKEFAETAQELRLDQKAADRLLALHQRAEAARSAQADRQVAAWRAELEADSDVMEHAEDVRALVREYAGADLRKMFETSWIGDHPGLVRFLVKVAREVKEARRW